MDDGKGRFGTSINIAFYDQKGSKHSDNKEKPD